MAELNPEELSERPDFWQIASVLLRWDGRFDQSAEKAVNGEPSEVDFRTFVAEIERVVDGDVLCYFVQERMKKYIGQLIANGPNGATFTAMAMWVEGFVMGYEFSKEKASDTSNTGS